MKSHDSRIAKLEIKTFENIQGGLKRSDPPSNIKKKPMHRPKQQSQAHRLIESLIKSGFILSVHLFHKKTKERRHLYLLSESPFP